MEHALHLQAHRHPVGPNGQVLQRRCADNAKQAGLQQPLVESDRERLALRGVFIIDQLVAQERRPGILIPLVEILVR